MNLNGANLEESNMAGVNLRVATLKNAILTNCDLRAAVLAGADLQVFYFFNYSIVHIYDSSCYSSFLSFFFV